MADKQSARTQLTIAAAVLVPLVVWAAVGLDGPLAAMTMGLNAVKGFSGRPLGEATGAFVVGFLIDNPLAALAVLAAAVGIAVMRSRRARLTT